MFWRWFLFFKQKTAYELRISDWSSVVCSSDLQAEVVEVVAPGVEEGIGIGHGRTSLLVTLGPQAEGPEQATERSPWMLGSSPSMTMEAGMTAAQDIAPRHPLCEPGSPLVLRSEEHTAELQSLMRIPYGVFCLKKKHHKTNAPCNNDRH